MNIGDGLTIQTRTVNGKASTGIFLMPSSQAKGSNGKEKFSYKSKTVKYPLRSRVEPTQRSGQDNGKRNAEIQNKTRKKSAATSQSLEMKQNKVKLRDEKNNQVKNAPNDTKIAIEPKDKNAPAANRIANKPREQKGQKAVITGKKYANKTANREEKQQNINTKFVTLTQDQLNTILSLVKSKNDVDVSGILSDDEKENKTDIPNEEEDKKEDSNTVEPMSVPGLDSDKKTEEKSAEPEAQQEVDTENVKNLIKDNHMKKLNTDAKGEDSQKKSSAKSKSVKEEKKETNKEDDEQKKVTVYGYDLCGALGGFGSREREKSKLEAERQQWIKDLEEQVKKKEQLKEEKRRNRTNPSQGVRSESDVVHDVVKNNKKPVQEAAADDKQQEEKSPIRSAPPSAKTSKSEQDKASLDVVRKSKEKNFFFFGEGAHGLSINKREGQQKLREELDRQRQEQDLRKKEEKKLRMSLTDEGSAWTKHFDTMQPSKMIRDPKVEGAPPQKNLVPLPSTGALNSGEDASVVQMEHVSLQHQGEQNSPRESAETSLMNNIYRGGHTTAAPGGGTSNHDQQRSTYLRTMTSLLDPAQIEALEVKRHKQDEHRRAIEAQVEERRRKKEEQANIQKRLEMEEDMRLAAERDILAKKTEIEKVKHQMQENVRERQTQELYQQMQQAQESALRDKLSRREQKLRDKGHDTSRLEKTHQLTLETKRRVTGGGNQVAQPSQTSLASTSSSHIPTLNLSQQVYSGDSTSPRQTVISMNDNAPVSFVAPTEQGPIKLQITLNNQQNQSELVETGVQTDYSKSEAINGQQRDVYDSDGDTEYLPLPQPRTKAIKGQKAKGDKNLDRKNPKQSLQKYEKGLDRQYDRFSRTEQNASDDNVPKPRKKEESKPKWGVGQKNKEFIPASKRYLNNSKWQQKHEANIRRREEQLLEQQALNNPERLRLVASQLKQHPEGRFVDGRVSPPVPTLAHQMQIGNKQSRRTRSHSPLNEIGFVDHHAKSPTSKRRLKQGEDLSPRRGGGLQWKDINQGRERPPSVVSATTERAKYRGNKHTRDSPIPETNDFVQYRRTSDILDPNQPQSRPDTGLQPNPQVSDNQVHGQRRNHPDAVGDQDPLLNPNMIRQRDRQEQILREISILRQGLLLKQREVASYPAAITHSISVLPQAGMNQTSLVLAGGGNLPERTNDTPPVMI